MSRKSITVLAVIIIFSLIAVVTLLLDREEDYSSKYEGVDLTVDYAGIDTRSTYEAYIREFAGVASGKDTVDVDITDFTGDGLICAEGVLCEDGSTVTWPVCVDEDGLYYIQFNYIAVPSRGVDISRRLLINGKVPFDSAENVVFSRVWVDGGEVRVDNRGNETHPSQIEAYIPQSLFVKDENGYYNEPYRYVFSCGQNSITLEALNEPVIITGLRLVPANGYITYSEYAGNLPPVTMTETAENWYTLIQGEDAVRRSSSSLYARYDRSAPDTDPYSVSETVLNYIGGDSWDQPGKWIEWEFDVPEDGYYNITIKERQMYQRGSVSSRMLYIDGKIPFEEAALISFAYDTDWSMSTLSNDAGAYRFYLEKGTHTLRLEASLGETGKVLREMEDCIYRLNQIYRKVLVLTGVTPDRFRDYNIKGTYPEIIDAMRIESLRLYKLVDEAVAVTGQKNDNIAVAQTLAIQLEQFVEKNSRITRNFTEFKDNITSLGTALQAMSETKLDIDFIVISGEKADIPKCSHGLFAKIVHEIRSCLASFVVDYNSVGNTYESDGGDAIDVWIVTGRDQSNVLKILIDSSFTIDTGIGVNLKLVSADSLLNAVVAGNGPDVVLSIGTNIPVNYAMRNSAEDLKQFEDYTEIAANFLESAITPFEYNGGVYALPETQTFSVLFYRKDILSELKLGIPETWDDLIDILPTLQGNNMTMGVPYPEITNPDLSVFTSLLFQNGGSVYDKDGKRTLIDSEAGVKAFRFYTSLYNDYGIPMGFDFVSRFRSGEMPVGIGSYTTYNTLMVSAPEIRGLWDFTLFPGTKQADGTIDRTVQSTGTCCMMLKADNDKVKQNAWKFMKWWLSTDTQVMFGREIESVMGSSARYATANVNALRQLPWSGSQLEVLLAQLECTQGFPEIPGGYSTTRHITNAVRKVINDKADAREVLIIYSKTINDEVRAKRDEFGLELD